MEDWAERSSAGHIGLGAEYGLTALLGRWAPGGACMWRMGLAAPLPGGSESPTAIGPLRGLGGTFISGRTGRRTHRCVFSTPATRFRVWRGPGTGRRNWAINGPNPKALRAIYGGYGQGPQGAWHRPNGLTALTGRSPWRAISGGNWRRKRRPRFREEPRKLAELLRRVLS